MADSFKAALDTQPLIDRLAQISSQIDDLSPAMLAIGEALTESTKQRFTTSTGPDGKAWKQNAPATLGQIHQRIARSGKKGSQKRAALAVSNKKPLIDSGLLQDTISYQLINDGNGVEIGTNRFSGEWAGGAAVHQFGSKDGNIPARPFLGISDSDSSDVLKILDVFMAQSLS